MIPVTHKASLSYLLRHPWQLMLAVLGVAIGVAVIVAVDLANSSARKAFLLSMDAVTGEATHQIIGGPTGVDERVYAELRVEHGLRSVAPIIEGTVSSDGRRLTLLGVDAFAEGDLRSFTTEATVDEGDGDAESLFRGLLVEPGAVVASAATAERLSLTIGDEFDVVAEGMRQPGRLIALFDDGGAVNDLLVVDIATAQVWLGMTGKLTRIDVRLEDQAAVERVESILPAGTQLLSAAARTRTTADLSNAFMTNLTAMSLLALLVGLFLIFNSVSFSVLQRRPLIGVLRALGFTRRQLLSMLLVEAALIGAAAALVGVLLGIVLGEQLLTLVSRSINDLYFRVSVTDVSVETFTIIKGMAAGVGASLVASAVPAIEATSYDARLAMTRSTLESRTRSMLPLLAVAGIATMLGSVVLLASSGRNLVAGLAAVFMLILGFSLCVPIFVRAAAQISSRFAGRLAGAMARMSISGIAAGLSRTAVAIVALAVAVSATIGVSLMVDSFRSSVGEWLEQTLQADIYTGVERGAMDPALIADISALEGVADYSTSRRTWLEDAGGRTQLVVIRMAPGSYAGTELLDADPAVVWPDWDNNDVVIVSEPYAFHTGVGPGDTVTLPTESGRHDFRVAATFQSYDVNASAIMISRATYDRHYTDPGVDSMGLYLEDGVAVDEVISAIGLLASDRQALLAESNVSIRDLSLEIFDQTFIITDILYWIAMGVAFIGILSAMLALQLERAREFATLRALGMTPGQVGGLISAQTGIIGLFAGIAAIPLGIGMAWVLIKVINRRAFGWQIDMIVSADVLVVAIGFAILSALLAGIYPAMRAARLRPAVAMREE
ncbi:MAG: FtsX-like permease family protein [Woeseiaceae bacterium]|nr:FtsX-like permease family protein [Woeseiaceae bacterium]